MKKRITTFTDSRNAAKRQSLVTAVLAAILVGWLAGCSRHGQPHAATAAPLPKIEVVRVIAGQPRFLTPLPGELRPYQDVRIRARVEGFVKHLFVDRGSQVRQGQTLALLSAPNLRAQRLAVAQRLDVAQARWRAAQADWVRDRATLLRLQASARQVPGSIAGNDIQIARQTAAADRAQAEARLAAIHGAAAELKSIQALTAYLRVTAPFSGMIVQRFVSKGSLVGPSAHSSALFRLQQLNPLRLVIPVPEAETAGIHLNRKVSFSVPAYPGKSFSGLIARIPDSLHQSTRVMPVELNVINPQWMLSPGMYAQVNWPVQRPYPTLLVPSSAVVATTQNTFVDLIRNGRIQRISVRRGFTIGNLVEIFGKLQAGVWIARRGRDELLPGARIAIVRAAPNL